MSQQLANRVQSEEEGYSDNINNLYKLFQVLKRQTKFCYGDQIQSFTFDKKITYFKAEPNTYEDTMRILWRMLDESYFKYELPMDVQGVHYFANLSSYIYDFGIDANNLGIEQIQLEPQFWKEIQTIFKTDYLKMKIQQNLLDYQNWLKVMYIYWKIMNSNKTLNKKQENQINIIKNKLVQIREKSISYNEKMIVENQFLSQQLHIEISEDQITHQIQDLQYQLINILAQGQRIIAQIQNQLREQEHFEETLVNGTKEKHIISCNNKTILNNILSNNKAEIIYLSYQITNLQMKQVAESITKIRKLQGSDSQFKVIVDFESAMDLHFKQISQKDFMKLNSLREYSLFNYYYTGCKSVFNFTSQNYLGFKQIYQKQHQITSQISNISIKTLKQHQGDPLLENFNVQFDKMEICHQCRMLFSPVNLRKCSYTSKQSGQPLPKMAYYDSYIFQIFKYQHYNPEFIKKINNRHQLKNSYFHYKLMDGQYHCERYYCNSCLKAYHRFKIDHFCPYCQGICNCSRCLRNGIIMKLKTIYAKLGGNIQTLQKASYFESLYHLKEIQNNYPIKKNTKNQKIPVIEFDQKQTAKLISIRAQLQQLRLLASMNKRRELYKIKVIQCEFQIFEKHLQKYGSSKIQRMLSLSNKTVISDELQLQDK